MVCTFEGFGVRRQLVSENTYKFQSVTHIGNFWSILLVSSFQLKNNYINIFENKIASFSKGSFSMFLILEKHLSHFILNNFNFYWRLQFHPLVLVLVSQICFFDTIEEGGLAMGRQGSGRRLGEVMGQLRRRLSQATVKASTNYLLARLSLVRDGKKSDLTEKSQKKAGFEELLLLC